MGAGKRAARPRGPRATVPGPAAAVSDGERFDLEPVRNGRLTVEALFDAAEGNVDLALADPLGAVVAASATAASNERLDAVVQAGQRYRVCIAGSNPRVTLRIANLLVDLPGSLAVYGTDRDDTIQLVAGAGNHQLAVNGVGYTLEAAKASSIAIDAGAGSDVILWSGTADNETAELRPDRASLVAEGRSFTALHAESIRVIGGGGNDTARFYDSPGDDAFQATAEWSSLTGTGFSLRAEGFRSVLACAGSGGTDLARLYDSPGDETFAAAPSYATVEGATWSVRVESFRYQYGYSSGGNDSIVAGDGFDSIHVPAAQIPLLSAAPEPSLRGRPAPKPE